MTYDLKESLIATSDPVTIFVDDGAVAYDAEYKDYIDKVVKVDKTFWDNTIYIPLTRYKTSFDANIVAGMAPMAFGMNMKTSGQVDGDTCTLKISDDEFRAGKLLGADIGFTFSVSAAAYTLHHHKYVWQVYHSYDTFASKDFTVDRFDLLYVLYNIVQFLLQKGADLPVIDALSNIMPGSIGTTGYWDKGSGLVDKGGKLTLEPKVLGDIEFNDLLLALGADAIDALEIECPPLMILTEMAEFFLKGTTFLKPKISFGVSVGCGSPVDISLTGYSLDDAEYTSLSFNDAAVGTSTSPEPTDVKDIKLTFDAMPRDSLLLGVYAKISWLKVISKEARKVWDFWKVIGATTNEYQTPIEVVLGNANGSDSMSGASKDVTYPNI